MLSYEKCGTHAMKVIGTGYPVDVYEGKYTVVTVVCNMSEISVSLPNLPYINHVYYAAIHTPVDVIIEENRGKFYIGCLSLPFLNENI